MLYIERLEKRLEEKRNDFVDFAESQTKDLAQYLGVLKEICQTDHDEIVRKIADSENIGAIPSREIDDLQDFLLEFGVSWNNHEEARNWASEVLHNRTTFAADGSLYYSEKETSLPVGAVQIGWFENPHCGDKDYEKDAELKILTPKDFLENQEEHLKPESVVGEEMFIGEVKKIGDFIAKKKGWQDRNERMPLAFFDRPMLLPFAASQSRLQKKFVQELVDLIRHSRDARVPVVGYVDRSFSRDLINLINAFSPEGTSDTQTLYDSTLLGSKNSKRQKLLSSWGDRTPFCYSKRKGLEAFIDPETEQPLVGFAFLQTTGNSFPARLDLPSWVYKDGLLNEILDVVRAECVIGLGYPYPIETADQAAVITSADRKIFLRALQEFAEKNNLTFSVSRKNTSKGRRR